MVAVNVAGGTRAGWRRLKPKPEPWRHSCSRHPDPDAFVGIELPGHMAQCPNGCGARRP